jgi:hypothetical protein
LTGVTVVQTLLVYVVAPLAVVAVLALLTLVPGRPKKVRYKPGQPWEHEPVWYEPHPVGGGGHGPTEAHGPAGVPGDGTTALGSSMYPEQHGERNTGQSGAPTAPHVGGDSHGARGSHVLVAGPSAAAAARPFGGARGTW